MSKTDSYLDWELSFRKKLGKIRELNFNSKSSTTNPILNSVGMTDNSFKDFMKKWKEENL